MIDEQPYLMISALQHALYCDRQFALIHLEQLWEENLFTVEGQLLHARVNNPHHQKRKCNIQEYALRVYSEQYQLTGVCDLVEIELSSSNQIRNVVPIEFKRGKKKHSNVDIVQLCAQALCLEEILGVVVPKGQIYYLQEHRRTDIELDEKIREQTIRLISRCIYILNNHSSPPAVYIPKKCDSCSLLNLCFSRQLASRSSSISDFIFKQIKEHTQEESVL